MAVIAGPVIRTRYLGPTNTRPARVVADHQRDSETVWRQTIQWAHGLDAARNHHQEALTLIGSCPMREWGVKILAIGHDHSAYYFIASQPHQ